MVTFALIFTLILRAVHQNDVSDCFLKSFKRGQGKRSQLKNNANDINVTN